MPATGLDKPVAHQEVAEITRMFRASRAAEEDARPRIMRMNDGTQVVPPRLSSAGDADVHWQLNAHALAQLFILSLNRSPVDNEGSTFVDQK
jgi:hypothetical protein